jgi:hypothetical protein
MRIRSRQVLRGLSASLTAIALLPACGANGLSSGKTSTLGTSTRTSATAAPATTAIVAPPTTQGPQTVQGPRTEKWIDLQVGDCLADVPAVDLGIVIVTIVDCATTHAAEVYLRAPMEVNAAIADVANQECAAGFSQYTGRSMDGGPFAVTYLIDSNQDRTSANPAPSTAICLLQGANGQPLTESARRTAGH